MQPVDAVTDACLAVRRDTFEAVGGTNDVHRKVALNDADLCLKPAARGWRSVGTPVAELIYHESKTRGRDDTPAKRALFRHEDASMRARWAEQLDADPYYHPHFTRQALDLSFGRTLPPGSTPPVWPAVRD